MFPGFLWEASSCTQASPHILVKDSWAWAFASELGVKDYL